MKRNMKLNLLVMIFIIISLASVQIATAPGQGFPKQLDDAINNGYWLANPYFGADTIYADQGSFFLMGWAYLQEEWDNDIFAQPIDFNLYINGNEVELKRTAIGHGIFDCWDGAYGECKGPRFSWYAVWGPNTFERGVLDFDIELTSSTDYWYYNSEVFVL